MKIIRLSFAILSLACIAHGATNETFEITSYFPDTGKVGITSGEGRTNRPFSSFSAEEQKQITDWRTDQEFESFGLSVEIEEHKTRSAYSEASDQRKTKGSAESVSYEVTVVNSREVVFNSIQIECRTFFLKDITQSTQLTSPGGDKYCRIDQFTLSIAPGETHKFNTSSVSIRNLRSDWVWSGLPSHYTKDDLVGFCVRVSREDRNGEVHCKTYEKGLPPNEGKWVDWLDYNQPRRSIDTHGPSENIIAKHTQEAEAGDYKSAFTLYGHYRIQKNFEMMKYWADKTRELIAKLPAEDPLAAKMLTTLDRLEKGTP